MPASGDATNVAAQDAMFLWEMSMNMNANFSRVDEQDVDVEAGGESRQRSGKTEKFRMRRIEYKQRRKRPAQFNGIHRRRRKKV